MPKALICLVANDVIRDSETNNISIHKVIEQYNVTSLPLFIPSLKVFTFWERKSGERKTQNLKLRILNNKKEISSTDLVLIFEEAERHRVIFTVNALSIEEVGTLSFQFWKGKDQLADYKVAILSTANVNKDGA